MPFGTGTTFFHPVIKTDLSDKPSRRNKATLDSTPTLIAEDKLLVFGGPYSNLQALEALLNEAEASGFSERQMICTGDIVAYCGQPQETVDRIRARGIATVLGNCEESLALDVEDCHCGFAEDSLCSLLSQQWYGFSRGRLDQASKAWMAGLPRQIIVEVAGRRLLAIHGAYGVINQFVFPSSPAEEKLRDLAAAGADGIIGGHSGLPFAQLLQGRLWLNSGALGMPANDGTPRVWYAILSRAAGGLTVALHSLDYDHATAAKEMTAAGLTNGYADCLTTGLWPSLGILPEAERAKTGQALSESMLFWPTADRAAGL